MQVEPLWRQGIVVLGSLWTMAIYIGHLLCHLSRKPVDKRFGFYNGLKQWEKMLSAHLVFWNVISGYWKLEFVWLSGQEAAGRIFVTWADVHFTTCYLRLMVLVRSGKRVFQACGKDHLVAMTFIILRSTCPMLLLGYCLQSRCEHTMFRYGCWRFLAHTGQRADHCRSRFFQDKKEGLRKKANHSYVLQTIYGCPTFNRSVFNTLPSHFKEMILFGQEEGTSYRNNQKYKI